MMLLQLQQITKYFGAECILANIKLEVKTRDRIALVGRNGAGKSTLLKIIASQLSYDSGQIVRPKGVTIGYLAQNTGLESNRVIWEEMLTVFDHVRKMEKDIRQLEVKMADPAHYENESLFHEYDTLQEKFKAVGGYQYESDIRSVLHGMRYYEQDYQTKISNLSGGQKTRLALAKLLLTKPDILILDEPTNHLDIETLSWLEQYLQGYEGAILIVSHDRYFLDKVVNQVYELSRHEMTKYHGNYSHYLKEKAEAYERDLKRYEKQQDEIGKMQDFIQRNLARASTTKRAQSRRKQLEKMQVMDRPTGGEQSATFSFEIERQSGNDVIQVKEAVIGYNGQALAKNIHFNIMRHDSIALVGPNGIGKSTLLKSLIRKLPLLSGKIEYGANVAMGYYDQEQAELSSNKTVLQELWDHYPLKEEKEIRTVLGNFLFSGDDVQKIVSTLSGGEKARLALAILMLEKANVLILDEPTNHLDLDSKEVLENALVDYPGTLLFVSHDRYFINRIATKVIELSTEGTIEYLGDYDYYVGKKQEMKELAELEENQQKNMTATPNQSKKRSFQEEKELKKLERQRKRRVEEIEQQLQEKEERVAELEEQLCMPEVFEDYEQVLSINNEIETLKEEIDELLEEWTELAELIQ
ncbi:ABC-F family ATP-binding cassette domain-containing protein [Lederbergia sp. NSJ-179]|uniref:ABC-F family ATP-binding cassette domain-containing protein n=1 Tax=Lederbergia sp. NSJ-179 TaxID=2931402 RepID=UPI001FD42ED7|nr:ABC-F family ATP-binding cassette domain-containing protein [Lederbergia sp. NSJ-179]MCJ7841365.1 ABC-F family ATP-binding cassette domain-containing protein [Lederbergia sp. NSJ-179]